MGKCVDDFFEELKARDKKREKMMSNDEYIKWLIDFTKKKYSFTDDDWSHSPGVLKNPDKENVEDLSILFEGIERYAEKNYLYPKNYEFGYSYQVMYNDTGLEVGICAGQGSFCFCRRLPLVNKRKFIDFNDIINNKKQENVKYIDDELDQLASSIVSVYKRGVPVEAIRETVQDAIDEIKRDVKAEKTAKSKKKTIR